MNETGTNQPASQKILYESGNELAGFVIEQTKPKSMLCEEECGYFSVTLQVDM